MPAVQFLFERLAGVSNEGETPMNCSNALAGLPRLWNWQFTDRFTQSWLCSRGNPRAKRWIGVV